MLRALDSGLTTDPGFQRAYPAEAAALAGLAEPRVAAAHDYIASAAGEVVAVIRSRLDGPVLSEVLRRLPRGLDSQTAATVVRDVLVALEALHARGVAHRAVHPDRIVVQPDGICVLVDAGLAARAADDDPAAAMAADLAVIPDLYAACASARQPEAGIRTLREWADGAHLEGMRGVLHTALIDALDAGRKADFGQGTGVRRAEADEVPETAGADDGADPPAPPTDPAGPMTDPTTGPAAPLTAAGLLGMLDLVAADSFDTGWEGLGRAQLATAAAAHRPPRLRLVELLSPHRVPRRQAVRGSHAAARRDNRELLDATGRVVRETWSQLVALWRDGRTRPQTTGRASHALRPPTGPSLTRYAAPLIAFLLTFGLVLIVLSAAHSSSVQTLGTPTQTQTTAAARAQPRGSTSPSASPTAGVTTAAGATSSATSVAHGSAAPTRGMTAPSGSTGSLRPTPTTVTALTVTGFGYTGYGNQVQAIIDVNASGTAPISVVVVFSSPPGWDTIPGGKRTHQYTLSGHTQYTITATVRIPYYCSFFGRFPVAVVRAAASVPPSHSVEASATRELIAGYC